MDLNDIYLMVKRWFWLLVAGLVVGLLAGLLVRGLQKPVYSASTRLFVSREIKNDISSFAGLTNQQLAQTYVQMLETKRLRDKTAEQLGIKVGASQVNAEQLPDTQIIDVKVEYKDADLAAQFANLLVQHLIEDNEQLRAEQYSARETSLTDQIEQVKAQIASLQSEYDQVIQQDYQDQLSRLDEQVKAAQDEYASLLAEISTLPSETKADKVTIEEKQVRVSQLETTLKIYAEMRANLIIEEKPIQNTRTDDLRLQQLQSTIEEYQKDYFNLLADLETVQSTISQQTPFAVQIEEAYPPSKPTQPSFLLYIALGGVLGVLAAGAVVTFIEALKVSQAKMPVLDETPAVDEAPAADEAPVPQESLPVSDSGQQEEQPKPEPRRRSPRKDTKETSS